MDDSELYRSLLIDVKNKYARENKYMILLKRLYSYNLHKYSNSKR